MTQSLFGIDTNTTIANTNMAPEALAFSQWLESVFQPVGYNGSPNPVTDPMACYQYLNNRRDLIQRSANQQPMVRLADKNLNIMASIGDYLHCEIEELMADSGKAKCVIRFENWLTNWIVNENSIFEDIHLIIDPIPTQPNWRSRWGGKITEVSIKNNEDGTATVELQAIANREHCKRLLFAANPIFSPEIQLPQMWILPGPTRTVLFLSMFINLARIFVPGLSFITNAFNPAAWLNPLNPDALLNLNPLSWPLQVAFVNPITDQSQWTALGATWTDWHSSMNDILSNSGVVCRAYTFLTTDEDSPYTDLVDLITGGTTAGADLLDLLGLDSAADLFNIVGDDIASLARPTRNCVVFSLEDDSGVTGPTGTALDGLLDLIAVSGDDLITASLVELPTGETLNGEQIIDASQPTAPLIQSLLGVAPAPPKVIWREGEYNGMLSSEVNLHKAAVNTVMTGGRSPSIVNEAQCVSADTLIDGPDGVERIDVLAKRGEPFRVWSVTPDGERVAATATLAFKKGTAELFEYTLADGRSIKTTAQHRFLTDEGFAEAGDITVGSWIATADHGQLSPQALAIPPQFVTDSDYKAVPSTEAVRYRMVVTVRSLGTDDYYDMHVPGWENYSANGIWNHNTFAIKFGLSQLQLVFTADETGIFGGAGEGPAPVGAGLDSLYQGQLDNVLLAWERYTDPVRAVWSGDLQFQEYFERGSSTAYTLAGFLTLAEANYKTRPFYGFVTQVRNGYPWAIDIDTRLGDRNGFEMNNIIYVDQITAVKRVYDRKTPRIVSLSIGDDRDKHDPVSQLIRTLSSIYMTVGAFLGEGTIFG